MLDATDPAAIVRVDGVDAPRRRAPYDPGVAFVMWTSGTTGAPKAILHTHEAYLELLDRVLGPLRAEGGRGRDPATQAVAQPHPGVARAERGHLQRAVRTARRRRARDHGQLPAEGVRRARAPVRDPLDRAAARCHGDARPTTTPSPTSRRCATCGASPRRCHRSRRAGSPSKFGASVLNSYGQAEIGEVIGWTAADAKEHPEKVGAIGRPHARRRPEGRRRRRDARSAPTRSARSSCARPTWPPGYATGEELARPGRRRRLREHRRPRARRRRRLRVDRGTRRRPHQPRRQQGVSRTGRGGALPRARDLGGGGGRRARRPARRGAGGVRGRRRHRRGARRRCAASISCPTRCRSRSSASTRCRAPRWAR